METYLLDPVSASPVHLQDYFPISTFCAGASSYPASIRIVLPFRSLSLPVVSVIKFNKQPLIIFKAVEFVHLTFRISFFFTNFSVSAFAKCFKAQFWKANEKFSVTLVHALILPQLLKQSRPELLQEDVFLSLTGFIIWTLSALNKPMHQCLRWSQRRKIVLSSFIVFSSFISAFERKTTEAGWAQQVVCLKCKRMKLVFRFTSCQCL